ncbi:properdin-like [Betta splendens]|uniref:Properdin-like n=1 Tax=Betta splendens TaxID=158456 RepID=A0A6P7N9E0_BETSP|nr:properdin-like [Betta splendens]
MEVLLLLAMLLLPVERSECVRCFARFNPTLGQCNEEIGDVVEDDCCQNPQYGYEAADGVCQSCGPPTWSEWSAWSHCTALCETGVRQRKRTCYSAGEVQCSNPQDKLETQPCSGMCCEDKGWGSWLAWSSCSISCGEGGVRTRRRVCSSSAECRWACTGPSEETENCPPQNTCPVHGGWSSWAAWGKCSGPCVDDQRGTTPSKQRERSCSNPPPSSDTVPPGDTCPGDEVQATPCSELPNCPVDGNWAPWSSYGPCSTSCGEGLQTSTRTCNNPAPNYGGRFCDGPNAQTRTCQNLCPVDGFWSGWSGWSECSASCVSPSQIPSRTRFRFCTNPAPSSSPAGRACAGERQQVEQCQHLHHCAVDGVWGSWAPFTPCPVTCGVGAQVSTRRCDSPAANHGGKPCSGEERRSKVCSTNVHCPVNGVWSDWSPWGKCANVFRKVITCKQLGGSQTRERECLHQAHNGTICPGDYLTESRVCYDVGGCYIKGNWEGWESWTLCKPACGGKSKRFRKRICKPDYKDYRPTIGINKEPANFFGTPLADCGDLPPDQKFEKEDCLQVPACN